MTMNTAPLLYLSAADVRRSLPMADAISAMREAFAQLSSGQVTLPTRECLQAPDEHGIDLVMPCHSTSLRMFSLKTVTVFRDNPQRGLPTVQALLILTCGGTGSHLAIMDGASLTALRTGGASAALKKAVSFTSRSSRPKSSRLWSVRVLILDSVQSKRTE